MSYRHTLNKAQLRAVADYLYDGTPEVAHLMSQIRAFKKGDFVLLWLVRNKIKGDKMVEFFRDESGDNEHRGVLLGVQKAMDYIEGRRFTTEKLKGSDLQ